MVKSKEEISPDDALQLALQAIDKTYGKGTVIVGNTEAVPGIEFFSSGSVSVNKALGGGWARGRIIEVFGPECIAGGSYIPFEVWNDETRSNHKGGTIERLYERFHNLELDKTPKQGRHLQNNDAEFYVKSVDNEGKIIRNRVLNVVKSGKKQCLKVELETGEVLFATKDHKFMTPNGFIPLSDLTFGDTLFVHNNTRVKGKKNYTKRPEVYVKYHPYLPSKTVVCNKTGKEYSYGRAQKSRMVYEAHMNHFTYDEYIRFLNTSTTAAINDLNFIPEGMHIHHKDENFKNNDINNLELIDPSKHGQIHAQDRLKNLSFVVVPSKIVNITTVGEHETYDLTCDYPYNNYIAEGIVVHNSSGKTTLCMHAIAEVQKAGGKAAFIDVEHAFDPSYAKNVGVDINTLLFSQPDSGEQALNVADMLVRTGAVSLLVIDSVAALVPEKELEGEVGDSVMGVQARMMSQAMRKICGIAHNTNTTIMFTNQIRMKIGIMFGNPECVAPNTQVTWRKIQRT